MKDENWLYDDRGEHVLRIQEERFTVTLSHVRMHAKLKKIQTVNFAILIYCSLYWRQKLCRQMPRKGCYQGLLQIPFRLYEEKLPKVMWILLIG